ncbi:formate dehydrogenase gamma subunit [Paraburkholderia sp. UCT70]
MLLALSGLALFHPSMFWLTALFGGGQWTRVLHPFVGVVMFVSFLILALRFWPHNLLDSSDIQWLRQIDDVLQLVANWLRVSAEAIWRRSTESASGRDQARRGRRRGSC